LIAHRGVWVEVSLLAEIEYRAKVCRGQGASSVLQGPTGGLIKLIHRFKDLTPEKRPQDPHLDGTGLRFQRLEHELKLNLMVAADCEPTSGSRVE
jgi:hypothetical protein